MSTGNYYKNAFIIELEKLNKCLEFNDKGGHLIISRENPEDLKTFLHEYYHYVLNVSTFVRVRDIYLEYSLKSLFSRTMIQNGESKGDVDFSKAQDDSLKNMVDIKNAYNGDMYHADYKKMRITDIQYQSPNLKLESKDIPYSIAVLTIEYESFGKTRMKEINFGNLIFEESLCKNVEGIVIGANNLSDIPY
jgi:hypothetical protein